MDARAEMALREVIRSVVSRDLDELVVRLERLEQSLSPSFTYREHVAQRRRVVVELRACGLSIAAIGRQLGVAASTVERDLQQTEHAAPDYVVGLDGKRQPSRKNGSRPAA
jgi:DNA-binding NarL/FixJ family response regulator